MNLETLVTCPVTVDHWENQLRDLIERHAVETGSKQAAEMLRRWDSTKSSFLQVCPKEMLAHLPAPLSIEKGAIPAE